VFVGLTQKFLGLTFALIGLIQKLIGLTRKLIGLTWQKTGTPQNACAVLFARQHCSLWWAGPRGRPHTNAHHSGGTLQAKKC
jgi:hypothetical protein